MRSFYPPKRIAARLLNIWHNDSSFVELRAFLERFFRNTYDFWLSREDPCSWLDKQGEEHYPKASWFEECQPLESRASPQKAASLRDRSCARAGSSQSRRSADRHDRFPRYHPTLFPFARKDRQKEGAILPGRSNQHADPAQGPGSKRARGHSGGRAPGNKFRDRQVDTGGTQRSTGSAARSHIEGPRDFAS